MQKGATLNAGKVGSGRGIDSGKSANSFFGQIGTLKMSDSTTPRSLIDAEREKLHEARLTAVRRSRLIALVAVLMLLAAGMMLLPPWESPVFSAVSIILFALVLYDAIRVHRLPQENLVQTIETGRQRLVIISAIFPAAFLVGSLMLGWMQS